MGRWRIHADRRAGKPWPLSRGDPKESSEALRKRRRRSRGEGLGGRQGIADRRESGQSSEKGRGFQAARKHGGTSRRRIRRRPPNHRKRVTSPVWEFCGEFSAETFLMVYDECDRTFFDVTRKVPWRDPRTHS